MDEREAYIALNMMEGTGPVGVGALLAMLGSARAILEADKADLVRARGAGEAYARAILAQRKSVDVRAEEARAESAGIRIVTRIDEEYPALLREIHDPPLALYVRGSLQERDRHGIAVVGTRRPTHYGRETAERLASQLARAGWTVVSGLALGIDTAAHRGALRAKGRTLAVLGSALDRLYPESNAELADRIAESGAVISEFPFGRAPDKTTFPMRNRIVSGLATGVVVVEAGKRSGALITAREALESGRNVFAVPGRVDSPASVGCHDLLKEGARLVTGVDDVIEEYEQLLPAPGRGSAPARPRPPLSDEEARVMEWLDTDGLRDVDGIIRGTGLAPATVGSILIQLEMKRLVRMLPGRVVEPVSVAAADGAGDRGGA